MPQTVKAQANGSMAVASRPAPSASSRSSVRSAPSIPPQVLEVIQDIYGTATADLFLVGAPIAALAIIAVLFIKEKPLSTLSGDERRAQEEAAALPMH